MILIEELGKLTTNLEELRNLVNVFVKILGIHSSATVHIVITNKHMGKRFMGKCYSSEKKHSIFIRKASTLQQKMKAIIHELTHVKQNVNGEYIFKYDEKKKDFKVYENFRSTYYMNEIEYKKQPWECEARLNEQLI